MLSNEEAGRLIAEDPRNRDVIFFAPRGKEDINNGPDQAPGRSIIDFHDWGIDQAAEYREPFAIIENRVKGVRQTNNRPHYRDMWWLYAERRPGMVTAISRLETMLRNCPNFEILQFLLRSDEPCLYGFSVRFYY